MSAASSVLLNNIFRAGETTLQAAYNSEFQQNPTTVISVPASGQLLAKRVYFLAWQPNSDVTLLCESLKRMISAAIEKASNENHHSIAFPAFGCGQFGCPITLVAKTLVDEVHRLRTNHPMSVSFVIQPDRTDIYDEFQKQINLLNPLRPLPVQPLSVRVAKGTIIVEMGDITAQKV